MFSLRVGQFRQKFQQFGYWLRGWGKGTVFFFPGIVYRHSLTRFSFFFSIFWRKKYKIFFFPGKVCRPLTRLRRGYLQKKVKNTYFLQFFHILVVFFFQLFFFLGKVYTPLTHSILGGRKKKQQWKKKYTIFTHSVDFCPKCAKNKLFRGNKKIRYLWWGVP